VCCTPCKIPEKDLQLQISFYAYVDSSPPRADHLSTRTATLTYSSTGANFDHKFWTGNILCPDGVSRQAQLICRENDITTGLASGGTVFLDAPPTYQTFNDPYTVTSWPAHNGFANPPMFNGNIGPLISGSFTCSPFFFENDFSDNTNSFGTTLSGAFGTITDPSPDTYIGNCCTTSITVTGCGGVIVPGATYTVWSDSGKQSQIDSGTTDSGGNVILDVRFPSPVSPYREISHPRFVTVTGSTTYDCVSKTESLVTPASGYTCLTGCGTPVANTIHATFATAGAKTLVNSGSGWTVSFTASTHSYVVTLAADTTLTITRDGVSCGTATWTLGHCPTIFSGTFTVPAGVCATELGSSATVTE
jgi:hypothetical protein